MKARRVLAILGAPRAPDVINWLAGFLGMAARWQPLHCPFGQWRPFPAVLRSQVPPDAQDDDLIFEMAPSEQSRSRLWHQAHGIRDRPAAFATDLKNS